MKVNEHRQTLLANNMANASTSGFKHDLAVVEGRAVVVHDEETSKVTITGTCRKEDVTADNTVLSTQIANKVVSVDNQGALRAASSRGWLLRLLDLLRPI